MVGRINDLDDSNQDWWTTIAHSSDKMKSLEQGMGQ